jgi:predicted nuclease with TOPRIM domain
VIDPDTGKATFDGETVLPPNDAELVEENTELRRELEDLQEEMRRLRSGEGARDDDKGDNPYFRRAY